MRILIIFAALISSIRAFDVKQLDAMVLPDYLFPGVAVEFNGEIGDDKDSVSLGLMVPDDIDSVVVIKNVNMPDARVERPGIESRGNEKWIVADLSPGKFRIILFYKPFETVGKRDFEFVFKTDQNLESAHLGVQKPISSENFSIQLEGAEKSTDQHGTEVYNSHIHDYRALTEKKARISYINQTGQTTMEALRAILEQRATNPAMQQPVSIPEKAAPVRHKLPTWEPLVALGVVAFAIIYFLRNQPAGGKKKNRGNKISSQKTAFCSSCGQKIPANAKFCSGCGKKIQ